MKSKKLSKMKESLRRIITPKKKTASAKATRRLIPAKPAKVRVQEEPSKRVILGTQEMEIEKAKFTPVQVKRVSRRMPEELPGAYGKDKIILQVRDPWWLYAYWEVIGDTWNKLRDQLKEIFYQAKKVLRVYDVSQINFNGKNAHRYFDIEINHEAQSWYIDIGGPGRAWCVDYGLRLPNGEFITIVRSNIVHTPIDGPSWITDEEWMVPEEMFGRLYGLGFGLGQSSPVGKAWQERVKKMLSSGALASPGMISSGSPVKKIAKQRKFWLIVDCELIVYGATEPDAKVTVQGKPIRLRQDGTFTLRFALPDGKQVIPVKAISSDEVEERTITPIVSRETKSSQTLK